jgi:23S rRNA pseudouridine1911/1915/1917 synthase
MKKRRPGGARLDIAYEDDLLVVVNKRPGVLAVPLERHPDAPSVAALLEQRYRSHGKRRPVVVHRIDQDTSGLVIFAKDAGSAHFLTAQFRRREPLRQYLAIVHGRPDPPAGTWRDWLLWDAKALIQKTVAPATPGAEEAISEYSTIEPLRGAALLEVRLTTGRRNQIRIQAARRGHPLVGERRYVAAGHIDRIRFERQALHASRLEIVHPSGERMAFDAPLPPDFADLLARLRPRRSRSAP